MTVEIPSLPHMSYFCVELTPAPTPAPAALPEPDKKLSKPVKEEPPAKE